MSSELLFLMQFYFIKIPLVHPRALRQAEAYITVCSWNVNEFTQFHPPATRWREMLKTMTFWWWKNDMFDVNRLKRSQAHPSLPAHRGKAFHARIIFGSRGSRPARQEEIYADQSSAHTNNPHFYAYLFLRKWGESDCHRPRVDGFFERFFESRSSTGCGVALA